MKMLKILLILLLLAGGFVLTYVSLVDVPIAQQEVVKTIPNDRFLKNE